MEKINEVRAEISTLVSQYCGQQAGSFFTSAYQDDTFPLYLHHSFSILKELMGGQKAKEQIDTILKKYSVSIPYE